MRDQVGRYQIRRNIAHGGMASVYLAYDPLVKRDVALKVLPHVHLQDPAFRARFEREGRIIADMEHPAIVPVYDYGEDEDLLYLVMRFMSGGSLNERLDGGSLTLDETLAVVRRIGRALVGVHERGIVHRDLKPSNVLFDRHGEAFLADFGIAKIAEATALYTGSSLIGTPAYMSPEQFHSNSGVGPLSDLYSLGAILFEMLTGRQPFPADSPAGYMMGHIMGEIPTITSLKPDLPRDLDVIAARVLAKEPEDRYQTVGDVVADLECVQRGQTPRVVRETALLPPPAVPSIGKRNASSSDQEEKRRPLSAWLPEMPRWAYGAAGVVVILLVLWIAQAATRMQDAATAAEGSSLQVVTVVATPTAGPATAGALTAPTSSSNAPTAAASPSPMATATLAPTRSSGVRILLPVLSLFSGPAYTFEVIATLQQDELVTVIGRTEDASWYNVVLADGREGWIPAGGTTPVDDDLPAIPTAANMPPTPTPEAPDPPIVPPTAESNPTAPPPPPPTAVPTNTPPPTETPTPAPTPTPTKGPEPTPTKSP